MRLFARLLMALVLLSTFGATTAHAATLLGEWRLEEAAWTGAAGQIIDASGNARHGQAVGSPLASPVTTSPARTGSPGTCGYGSFPGPAANGGAIDVGSVAVATATGTKTSVSFWMYWNGADNMKPFGFSRFSLSFSSGHFGFHSNNADIFGISSAGLANRWVHVVAVFTDRTVASSKLYIDGVLQASTQRMGAPNNGNADVLNTIRIGGWRLNTSFRFIGSLDEVRVYDGELTAGEVTTVYGETHLCAGIDHIRIVHGATGLTCAPTTLTIRACASTDCSTLYTAGGVTGTLTAVGGPTVNWTGGTGFSIGISGSTTKTAQVTTAGTVTWGASGVSPTPNFATQCDNGGGTSCNFASSTAGFIFDVPNHVSEVSQAVTVSAVKASDSSTFCVPGFASVTKAVTFTCTYSNPATGTLPVRVGGSALNAGGSVAAACDGGGRSVNLVFNAGGQASTTVQYADVGRMTLGASYTGAGSEAGLVMTGTDTFIAAPASFAFSAITAAPIRAGSAFSATVTARNNTGAAAPNFGRETAAEGATLTFTRRSPTGAGASNGIFSGSLGGFTSGSATASNLVWSEVGTGDLTATLTSASYLGSGLSATGTTGAGGAVGRFTPHHFDVAVTAACGTFTHSGQPFAVTVTARNGLGVPTTTVNYDGGGLVSPAYSKVVTLSDAPALGSGSFGASGTVAAGAFVAGVASASPAFTFTNKTSAPQTLVVRATDTDTISSSGHAEGSTPLRSGRLRVANGFGSERSALQLQVLSEYWSGAAWVVNGSDSCTTVPAAAVALSNYRGPTGGAGAWTTTASAITISGGSGLLTLAAPSGLATGSVDLALNLGDTTTDQSCLASHPASTAGALPWLRARHGSCATTWDRDPSARASFGIFTPETRKTVHVRDLF